MTIIHNQILNILFSNKGVEFIATDVNKVIAFHDGKQLNFNSLPPFAYIAIKEEMGVENASLEQMEVWAYRNLGGFDDKIDITADGKISDPEYVSGYSKDYNSQGISISEAQLRVLKNIPVEDKAIADTLCLSIFTVHNHCRAIYSQLGPNRAQTVQSAILKGII